MVSCIGTLFAFYSDEQMIDAANSLAEKKFINDRSENPSLYAIDKTILRQEIAAIARSVGWLAKSTYCNNIFQDVTENTPNNWACFSIEPLVEKNLISANEYFRPEDEITKAETLWMLIKAIGFDYTYNPSSSKNWQEQIVEFAVKKWVIDDFKDYDTKASRWWVFIVADATMKKDEEEKAAVLKAKKLFSDEVKWNDFMIWGDRDEYWCIWSAGYSRCEARQECIRPWEIECRYNVPENDGYVLINVTVSPVEGLELEGKNYVITIDDKSAPFSSAWLTTTVEAKPSDVSIVTLATEFGEPILISYSNTNNKQAELSVESSADVFVMRSPRFYGVKINDMEELSKRIRAHASYPELIDELSERIKNSPCPMDASCSAIASLVAEEIAQDINLLDLVEKE